MAQAALLLPTAERWPRCESMTPGCFSAVAIFATALIVIATERVDRTKVALVGAMLVVLSQTIDQEHAIEAVDWETIGLLAGMMLIVRVTEPTGIYTFLAIRAGQLARGRPFAVVMSLALSTALLSAFLDNLTTVLLMVPITFLLADALDIDPIPLVLIEIIASNIGGTATLIGDPPNILIAGATGLVVRRLRRSTWRRSPRWPSSSSPGCCTSSSASACRSRPRRASA